MGVERFFPSYSALNRHPGKDNFFSFYFFSSGSLVIKSSHAMCAYGHMHSVSHTHNARSRLCSKGGRELHPMARKGLFLCGVVRPSPMLCNGVEAQSPRRWRRLCRISDARLASRRACLDTFFTPVSKKLRDLFVDCICI